MLPGKAEKTSLSPSAFLRYHHLPQKKTTKYRQWDVWNKAHCNERIIDQKTNPPIRSLVLPPICKHATSHECTEWPWRHFVYNNKRRHDRTTLAVQRRQLTHACKLLCILTQVFAHNKCTSNTAALRQQRHWRHCTSCIRTRPNKHIQSITGYTQACSEDWHSETRKKWQTSQNAIIRNKEYA